MLLRTGTTTAAAAASAGFGVEGDRAGAGVLRAALGAARAVAVDGAGVATVDRTAWTATAGAAELLAAGPLGPVDVGAGRDSAGPAVAGAEPDRSGCTA